MWDVVAQWLEHRTLNQEDWGSNPLAAISKLGQFRSLSCIGKYLAIGSKGYMRMDSFLHSKCSVSECFLYL